MGPPLSKSSFEAKRRNLKGGGFISTKDKRNDEERSVGGLFGSAGI